MQEHHFQLITSCTMYVNARHVNDYILEAVMYVPIIWILYWTELGLRFFARKMACDGIRVANGPVGLSKPLSREFCLKYLSNPYTINK